MGQFLYYRPGESKELLNRHTLRESPLEPALRDLLRSGKAFQDRVTINTIHAKGPDGGNGALVMIGETGGLKPEYQVPEINASHQQWVPMGGRGWWLGKDDRFPPCEADLRRDRIIAGYERLLGNGEGWTCPTIRRFDAASGGGQLMLPRVFRLNAEGQRVAAVDPVAEKLWNATEKLIDGRIQRGRFLADDLLDTSYECLTLNYRLGPYEVDSLALLGTDTLWDVVEAALDLPMMEHFLAEGPSPNA